MPEAEYKITQSFLFLILFLSLFNCTNNSSTNNFSKVKVGMMFIPNVQFAPFYAAVDKGYYSEAKLDVSFDFSSQADAIQLVGIGKFDFVVGDGEQVIIARDKGLPIKYIMAIYSKYPIAIASLSSSGIKHPLDLVNRTIGIPEYYGASYIGLKALLKKFNLSESVVNIIAIGYTQAASISQHRVDAAVVYLNNTPVQMRAAGKEINIMPLHQYISFVSAGVITNDNMINNHPDVVKRFVNATLRGLNFVQQYPEKSLEICFKFINEGANNRKIQYKVLKESIKLYNNNYTKTHGLGFQDPATWENTQKILLELNLIKQKRNINLFYTNKFLLKKFYN